ncbi:hypothetical protein SDC9_152055 [bioreactor metagenome]|uniref:Uncharacterized protein n=1 Tax=bioreactor metagenome TaxID=1076179 RepID=A0A645ESK3_9ZZZZ
MEIPSASSSDTPLSSRYSLRVSPRYPLARASEKASSLSTVCSAVSTTHLLRTSSSTIFTSSARIETKTEPGSGSYVRAFPVRAMKAGTCTVEKKIEASGWNCPAYTVKAPVGSTILAFHISFCVPILSSSVSTPTTKTRLRISPRGLIRRLGDFESAVSDSGLSDFSSSLQASNSFAKTLFAISRLSKAYPSPGNLQILPFFIRPEPA